MENSKNYLIKIHYKGTLDNGEVFDSSEGREPLEFVSGLGMIIPGLEKEVETLEVGDKKTIKVNSEEAYGPILQEAIQNVPKDQFPQDIELKEGMQLAAQGPHGVIPVTIKKINENDIEVDFNHPLAGKDLTFEVEIVEKREANAEDISKFMPNQEGHSHDHGEGGCCGGSCGSEDCSDENCKSENKKE
jgi:peptidylprolyl isomerase